MKFSGKKRKVIIYSATMLTMMGGVLPNAIYAHDNINIIAKNMSLNENEHVKDVVSSGDLAKLYMLGILSSEGVSQGKMPSSEIKIDKAELVKSDLIAVTFSTNLERIDKNDIAFKEGQDVISIQNMNQSVNKKGQTVVLFHTSTKIRGNVYVEVVRKEANQPLKQDKRQKLQDIRERVEKIGKVVTVSKDDKGDYHTVQEAINAIPSGNKEKVTVFIFNGVYKEVVTVSEDKDFVSLIGENVNKTKLTYDNYSGKEKPGGGTYGTSGSASVYIYGNDFTAENLTFENSFDEKSVDIKDEQAVAVYTKGERQVFKNTRFIGNQDTLYTKEGTQYFYKCYIEGDVDFIFGGSQAVFEKCDIMSLTRGSSTVNGYVTAPSTQITDEYGYLFIKSRLLSNAEEGTVYLGRPWHPGGDPHAIGSVVFRESYLGSHINKQGWTDMSGFSYRDARFYEYKNHGPGVAFNDSREQLTREEANQYTIQNVLNGWNPKEKVESEG
ncbi:pectinesterase family protein [Priestia filamentosa]|uniref:pectinesterase family protein n=1 Tax=Priestia filamentosa TaxID=1402861 RepID=UPI0002D923D5|nr:pectinesterase family protein [Priestia filamentosa]